MAAQRQGRETIAGPATAPGDPAVVSVLGSAPTLMVNDQPIAQIQFGLAQEVAIAMFPGAVREITTEAPKTGFHIAEFDEGGDGAADTRVQIGMRPTPVGPEEAIGAIVGHQEGADLDGP
jgi:hypothetical protein